MSVATRRRCSDGRKSLNDFYAKPNHLRKSRRNSQQNKYDIVMKSVYFGLSLSAFI